LQWKLFKPFFKPRIILKYFFTFLNKQCNNADSSQLSSRYFWSKHPDLRWFNFYLGTNAREVKLCHYGIWTLYRLFTRWWNKCFYKFPKYWSVSQRCCTVFTNTLVIIFRDSQLHLPDIVSFIVVCMYIYVAI
jgi:hypothetical protein